MVPVVSDVPMRRQRIKPRGRWSAAAEILFLIVSLLLHTRVNSFQSVALLPALHRTTTAGTPAVVSKTTTIRRDDAFYSSTITRTTTSLNMFMGSDGGLLGVGGPEIFTILLVGYFVLGPSDLYKVVKEVGKFIQNIRTLGTDLSTTFENNMESTLQLDELRKAQRELNDAFSFRRSINVDADGDAFSVQAGSAQEAEAAAAAAAAASTVTASSSSSQAASGVVADPINARPKKIRRRVRKKEAVEDEEEEVPDLMATPFVNNVPDLEMPELVKSSSSSSSSGITAEEAAEIEAEFDQYVLNPSPPTTAFSGMDDWYGEQKAAYGERKEQAAKAADSTMDQGSGAQNRFQQQLSGNWNDQILAAGDKLEPMALVMNKIALLEQEKMAAIRRLEEEFAKRTELEEKYYQEQRKLLEEASNEVQNVAFGVDSKTKV